MGATVKLVPNTDYRNRVMVWYMDAVIFCAKVTDLVHGGDGELDPLCIHAAYAFDHACRKAIHGLRNRVQMENENLDHLQSQNSVQANPTDDEKGEESSDDTSDETEDASSKKKKSKEGEDKRSSKEGEDKRNSKEADKENKKGESEKKKSKGEEKKSSRGGGGPEVGKGDEPNKKANEWHFDKKRKSQISSKWNYKIIIIIHFCQFVIKLCPLQSFVPKKIYSC